MSAPAVRAGERGSVGGEASAPPEPEDSGAPAGDEDEGDLEEDFQLPPSFEEIAPLQDAGDAPEEPAGYGDLLDADWIQRGAHEEDLDDDGSSLEVGMTLDIGDAETDEDAAPLLELDVGPLLTFEVGDGEDTDGDATRDQSSLDATLGAAALGDWLLTDESEDAASDEEIGDDERFPAFDDGPVSAPRDPEDAGDHERIGEDDELS